MLGKRPRSMQRVTSGISMGVECPLVETVPPAEPVKEKQNSLRFRSPCPPRVIIGFSPQASLEKDDDYKSLPEINIPACASPKPRPTSGLESLRSSPRPSGERNLQTAGVGLQVALSPYPGLSSADAVSKTGVIECAFKGCSVSIHHPHGPPPPECRRPVHSRCFGNTCKESRPISIAQSPLDLHPSPLYKVQPHHPNDQLQRGSVSSSTRCARKFAEDNVHEDVEVERCIFSLPSSPGIHEVTDQVSLASMDFMEACFFCNRHLGQGHDIFMYKGDKAFCSDDCRYQQILIDERAELRELKCASVALKAGVAIQSRGNNHKNRVLSAASTAAAA